MMSFKSTTITPNRVIMLFKGFPTVRLVLPSTTLFIGTRILCGLISWARTMS
jgi:hypothetical protein